MLPSSPFPPSLLSLSLYQPSSSGLFPRPHAPPFPLILTIPFLLSSPSTSSRAIFLLPSLVLFSPIYPSSFFLLLFLPLPLPPPPPLFSTFSFSPSFSPVLLPFYYLLSSEDEPPRQRGKARSGRGGAGDWIVSSIYTTFGFQFSFFRNGASPSLGHAPSVPPLFQKVLEFRERSRISRASTTRRWITKRRYNDQGLRRNFRQSEIDCARYFVVLPLFYLSRTSETVFSLHAFLFLFPILFFPLFLLSF